MVNGGRRIENLAGERLNQARSSVRAGASKVNTELVRAYRWAMSPSQADPQRAEYGLSHYQSNASDSGEIVQAALSIFIQEEALVDEMSPAALATLLGQYVWNKGSYGSHVTVDALWELMTGNVYLHRLRNRAVLSECIQKGVPGGAFGYKENDSADVRFGEPLPGLGQIWEHPGPCWSTRSGGAGKGTAGRDIDRRGTGGNPRPGPVYCYTWRPRSPATSGPCQAPNQPGRGPEACAERHISERH